MTDREWDKRLRIRTVGREDEADPNYSPYEPTPYAVLERLAESGLLRRKHRLLDYGCGKGRVAFFMASVVGCRVTGIDHSPKLIDMAKENRRASGAAGKRIAPHAGNHTRITRPDHRTGFQTIQAQADYFAASTLTISWPS